MIIAYFYCTNSLQNHSKTNVCFEDSFLLMLLVPHSTRLSFTCLFGGQEMKQTRVRDEAEFKDVGDVHHILAYLLVLSHELEVLNQKRLEM